MKKIDLISIRTDSDEDTVCVFDADTHSWTSEIIFYDPSTLLIETSVGQFYQINWNKTDHFKKKLKLLNKLARQFGLIPKI